MPPPDVAGFSWGLVQALTGTSPRCIGMLVNRLPQRVRIWLHQVSLLLELFGAWDFRAVVDQSLLFGTTGISLLHTSLAMPLGLGAGGHVAL